MDLELVKIVPADETTERKALARQEHERMLAAAGHNVEDFEALIDRWYS